MKRVISLALLGMFGIATLAGCEASAKIDTDGVADHNTSVSKTTVKREAPSGQTTYERKTTTVNP